MHLGRRVTWVGAPLALGLLVGLGPPSVSAVADAAAAEGVAPRAAGTRLTLAGAPAYAGETTPLRIQLTLDDGTPVPGAAVTVERRRGGVWEPVGQVTTGDDGRGGHRAGLARIADDNVWRAVFPGGATHAPAASGAVPVALIRRASVLTVTGPASVVDERTVEVALRWRTGNGTPVAGPVRVDRRIDAEGWVAWRTVRTGADGVVTLRVRPRRDTRWRAAAAALDWVEGASSAVHRVNNLPSGPPVRLPAAAPRPRRSLPAQPRAVGPGARAVVTRIPDGVWRQMTGVTWHAGCPVGRSGLRLVRVNYWGYDGYRRRGELVAATGAAPRLARALSAMHRRRLPLRSLARVDRFGWSSRLRGGNDYASMAAGNTSAFNCRDVVGAPGVRSPHAWGRALDLNPWENPYRSSHGWVPHRWWVSRSHPRVAWRSHGHAVVRLMARHGLRWTYGRSDAHHFDAVLGAGGRVLAQRCGATDCE